MTWSIQDLKREDCASPTMDTNQYRKDFAAYNSKLEYAHFEYRAGLDPDLRVASIYERYGDLFTEDSVKSLRHAEANVSAHLGTERAGLQKLFGAACIGFLDAQAKDLTAEGAARETSGRVTWEGESLPTLGVPRMLANEVSPTRRRDLYARWLDVITECDDLRTARFDSLHQSACVLGFDSYRALYSQIVGTDYEQLAGQARAFLNLTEMPYKNSLARITARDIPDVPLSELHHADYFYFQRIASLDQFFPASSLMTIYETAMEGLGIHTKRQTNIRIDAAVRPLKHPRASCLRINPPEDVRLLVSPIGGATDYLTLFHEAGHAQHFGWTSRDMMYLHPEFIYSPDYATTESFAFLLNHLFHDARWLKEYRPGLSTEQARMIARDLAVLTTHTIRRFCARIQYDILLHDAAQLRSEQVAAAYAALQTEATGFLRGPGFYLSDVDDGFYSGAYLRAWAFEAALREYLRTRYGYRWWASRKAGDELIDIWSTSSRYSVEDLARLLGLGELNFDQLAETWIASMSEE